MITKYNNTFLISEGDYSYCFYEEGSKLYHAYYGKRLNNLHNFNNAGTIALSMYEYPEFGRGDFRSPSVIACVEEGIATDFRYQSYKILPRKPEFIFPSLRNGGETLEVVLKDDIANLLLKLYYTPYSEGIAKRVEIINLSDKQVKLEKLMSSSITFPEGNYDLIELSGAPIKERQFSRGAVSSGLHIFSSLRGRSSHEHSPFCAILNQETTEESGDAYGVNLIYSGNFLIEVEKDELSQVRVNTGLNVGPGGIILEAGETFVVPECIMVYSSNGIGGMSRNFHKLYRKHLLNPNYLDKLRPIVINSWESVVFNLSEEI